MERTARPCRPPLLTLVCKRGGRPPSAFRLLPCPSRAGSLHTSACRVGLPILIVLDQNRWTGTCIADTLRSYLSAASREMERKLRGPIADGLSGAIQIRGAGHNQGRPMK